MPLCQFAYPAVAGSGVAPDGLGLWGPAEHWLTCVIVTKGRVELPRRKGHDVLNVGCLPVPSLGRAMEETMPAHAVTLVTRAGLEPASRE